MVQKGSQAGFVQVLFILLLLAGIGIALYLVQNPQILKSRASGGSFINAFEFKDKDGNLIKCDSSTTPPTCTTKSLDIQVRVKDVNALLP